MTGPQLIDPLKPRKKYTWKLPPEEVAALRARRLAAMQTALARKRATAGTPLKRRKRG